MPVAVLEPAGNFYIAPDHLGSPHQITDSSGAVVWLWHPDPFGNGDPTGAFTYALRFPGQYFDQATRLHYNYFRDYDPRLGRYIESDPIGLAGGINTYAYVRSNPISNIDPLGLWTVNIGISVSVNIPIFGPVAIGSSAYGGIVFDGTNWAWYSGGGGGISGGAGGSLGIQIGGSNAKSVCDLRGLFLSASGSGGEGIVGGGEGYVGQDSNGGIISGGNGFLGIGGGTPVSGIGGATYTNISPW